MSDQSTKGAHSIEGIRLAENIDFLDAQFSLGEFCLNYLPDKPHLSRNIQNANSVSELRHAIAPIYAAFYIVGSSRGSDLTKLIQNINQSSL